MCEGFTHERCNSNTNYFKFPYCLIFLHNYITFMARTFLFSNAHNINAKHPLVAREKKKRLAREFEPATIPARHLQITRLKFDHIANLQLMN